MFLLASHSPLLVAASVLVAILASFTGLRIASGLRALEPVARKREIAKAAIALGGGIWAMHFIAMLSMRMSRELTYAALPTLGSVLVASLITGIGLLILHCSDRTPRKIGLAGILMGMGIVSMHYLGMAAIGGKIVTYQTAGFFLSSGIAVGASVCALWLAYKRRALQHIAIGSVLLGISISAMHYSAMAYTRFVDAPVPALIGEPFLSSGSLALLVAVVVFLICGFFLLTAVSMDPAEPLVGLALTEAEPVEETQQSAIGPLRLPYQHNNAVHFIDVEDIAAIQADGHYTRIFNGKEELFCPWPISRVEETLKSRDGFVRTHRSYLVNMRHVKGFQRNGDKAFCLIGNENAGSIPVSRSRIGEVRAALQLA
jgi:NO-binding membrane sensor protein with MHYT domain